MDWKPLREIRLAAELADLDSQKKKKKALLELYSYRL